MKANIVRVGNSQGIRIPKVVLQQTSLSGEVELEVRGCQIIIRAVARPRQNWAEAFRAMAQQGDDQLLDADVVGQTVWEREEWLWK